MKLNMLVPYHATNETPSSSAKSGNLRIAELRVPNEMSKERLIRKSAYWPITISGSLLFPMAVV